MEDHVEVHPFHGVPLFFGHVEELADDYQPGDVAGGVQSPEAFERLGDERLVALSGAQVDVGDGVDCGADGFEFGGLVG
jgi:hypothetical protein